MNLTPQDSIQFAFLSRQDVNETINYIVSFIAIFLVAPFTAWLGRKFQRDDNADKFESIIKKLDDRHHEFEEYRIVIAEINVKIDVLDCLYKDNKELKDLLKDIRSFCNHIHDDINQMRSDDPNMTRSQVMANAHFYFNHYSKHLSSYVDEVSAVDDIRNNWDKVSNRMLAEHLDVYRRLKTMLSTLVYKDRNLSDFADEYLRSMFIHMANYVMRNLWNYVNEEDMDEKDLELYYENWRSKMMGIFSNYVDYGHSFKDQMEKDGDWTMGSRNNKGGDIEFFIPKPTESETKKNDKRKL